MCGMCGILNIFFSTVFTEESTDKYPVPESTFIGPLEQRLINIEMDHDEIVELLRNLRTDKSTMLNDVAQRMLNELGRELAEPIALLFRQSLSMGIVPEDWKSADVTLI